MKQSLGNRIKTMRINAGMTQQQIADAVGCSRVAVTKWESGDTKNLKFDNLIKLMAIYKTSFDDLVGGHVDASPFFDEAKRIINSLESDHDRLELLHQMKLFAVKKRHGEASGKIVAADAVGIPLTSKSSH